MLVVTLLIGRERAGGVGDWLLGSGIHELVVGCRPFLEPFGPSFGRRSKGLDKLERLFREVVAL